MECRYGWPFVAKFNNVYICMQQSILIQLQPRIFSFNYYIDSTSTPSSETQGQLVGAGERLNGRGKKSGEEKSRTKVGAPGILLLTDQFRNHLKSLPVIGHKNIFCAQSESSSFRVTFVTSYSKLSAQTSCSPVRRLFTCSCRRVSLGRKVPLKREL